MDRVDSGYNGKCSIQMGKKNQTYTAISLQPGARFSCGFIDLLEP